jgi:deoxyribodipyrimidine photolyase-related protein
VDADYFEQNWFNHTQPLPEFFLDASKTDMNCLRQVLTQVEGSALAHDIQRLMILSNFGLLGGISPTEVEKWFHSAFVDA